MPLQIRQDISICMVGLIWPTLLLSHVLGFNPIAFKPATKTSPARFKWSLYSIFLWFVFGAGFIAIIVMKMQHWPSTGEVQNVVKILFVIEFINQSSAFCIILSYWTQARGRAVALNQLSSLIYDPPRGLERAISKDCEREIRRLTYYKVAIILSILVFLSVAVVAIFYSGDTVLFYRSPWLYFADQLASCFDVTTFVFTALDCSLFSKIMMSMCKSVHDSTLAVYNDTNKRTESTVDHKHDLMEEPSTKRSDSATLRICTKITEIRTAYGEVMKIKGLVNDCMNPQIAVSMSLTLVIVVLNSYLLFLILISGQWNKLAILSLAKVALTLLAVVIEIHAADDLSRMRDTIISTASLIKSCYLDVHESTQIEMIMRHVMLTPPAISGSGIFTCTAQLLPSLFGATVTYVLVALQFRMEN